MFWAVAILYVCNFSNSFVKYLARLLVYVGASRAESFGNIDYITMFSLGPLFSVLYLSLLWFLFVQKWNIKKHHNSKLGLLIFCIFYFCITLRWKWWIQKTAVVDILLKLVVCLTCSIFCIIRNIEWFVLYLQIVSLKAYRQW